MATPFEIRDLLEQAAAFERGGDPPGAVARARRALDLTPDGPSREEVCLALSRFEVAERAWRDAIDARQRAFAARERAEARVIDEGTRAPARLKNEQRQGTFVGERTQPLRGVLRWGHRKALSPA